ncbi:hypothetical protein, partial [Streptomyces sp. NPDC003379]
RRHQREVARGGEPVLQRTCLIHLARLVARRFRRANRRRVERYERYERYVEARRSNDHGPSPILRGPIILRP